MALAASTRPLETSRLRILLSLGSLLRLTACGGGGGGGTGGPVIPPAPVTVDVPADAATSGYTSSLGASASGVSPQVGDVADDSEVRGIFTFSNAIPGGATLTAAVLREQQTGVPGSPYTEFSALAVDSVDLAGLLDAPDHASAALSSPGNLTPFDATLGVKTLSVLAAVNADRTAGRSVSSFRVAFVGAPSVDAGTDRAVFGLLTPGTEAVLRITYQP